MTTVPITVTIPVGPYPSNTRWLGECLQSVFDQTVSPDEMIIIADGVTLRGGDKIYPPIDLLFNDTPRNENGSPVIRHIFIHQTPWQCGVAHAFNFGVALAHNDLVVMLGSDDKLLPNCIEKLWQCWEGHKDPMGYYFLALKYSDGREQNTPCNAAMVHKHHWRVTGGFPVESAVGAPDTMLCSIMLKHYPKAGTFYKVSEEPLYWYRYHPEIETHRKPAWGGVVHLTRDLVTQEWTPKISQ